MCLFLPFLVHMGSLKAPFFYDDIAKIVQNPDIRSLDNSTSNFIFTYRDKQRNFSQNDPSRPMTYLSFALNYHFNKYDPFGYHLVNILLHCMNTLIIFILLNTISRLMIHEVPIFFPISAAMFFGVHPVTTSAVSYVFSRSDLLSTLFALSSFLFFSRSIHGSKWYYFGSLFSFIISIFSKQITVVLPLLLLLMDFFLISEGKIELMKKRIHFHIPFWCVVIAYLGFRLLYLGGLGDLEAKELINQRAYIITQPYVILQYIKLLIFPVGLSVDHLIDASRSIVEFRVVIPALIIISIGILIAWIVNQEEKASYTHHYGSIVAFFALWFFICLIPTSSIFPTSSLMVDNRMYFAGIGFCGILGISYQGLFTSNVIVGTFFKRKLLPLLMLIHLGILAFLTLQRNKVYASPELIWKDVLVQYPKNYRAHYNLGSLYYEKGEYEKAKPHFESTILNNPKHSKALNNLALIHFIQNDIEKAESLLQASIRLNPNFKEAYLNLGSIHKKNNSFLKAEACYKRSVEIDPKYSIAWTELGALYFRLGRWAESEHSLNKALEIDPGNMKASDTISRLKIRQKHVR